MQGGAVLGGYADVFAAAVGVGAAAVTVGEARGGELNCSYWVGCSDMATGFLWRSDDVRQCGQGARSHAMKSGRAYHNRLSRKIRTYIIQIK